MGHLAAAIFFIQQSSLDKRFGVLGDGFKVCREQIRDRFNCNPVISFNREQNINPPVISSSFEISLQLS